MDESLYRVVRMDKGSHSVRYGTIHMVKGIVRDVKQVNANRLRISRKMDGYPYQPVELIIQRVIVSSYQDATADFLKDDDAGDDDNGGGGTREPRGTDPHSPTPGQSGLCGADSFHRALDYATDVSLIREPA